VVTCPSGLVLCNGWTVKLHEGAPLTIACLFGKYFVCFLIQGVFWLVLSFLIGNLLHAHSLSLLSLFCHFSVSLL
jgi:hypothetical protein